MQIIQNFHNIDPKLQNSVLTIGNFDGIHLGHQEILNNAKIIASSENIKSALLTFDPHPLKIIRPEKKFNRGLFSLSQKLDFLKEKDLVDAVFISQFDEKLANLSAEDFVREILVEKLKIKHLIIGYDFIFGKNRVGDANLLQKLAGIYNFSFHQIAAKRNHNDQVLSSTKIRNFIESGDLKSANKMLGRNYQICGTIIRGKQLARTIGFPTANFLPQKDLIKPKFGVYKAKVFVDKKDYSAILNFGIKPTFNGSEPLFEVHIFDFNQEIYDKEIVVELIDFIREEKKFSGIEELKTQIQKDVKEVLNCE
ncbi:MAG: riboflavin kinase/FMN adenylyltransferase [Rickettsiales bacterium]|jgi:riboflavin kinase/FMN adenylyltransferase